MDMTIRFPGGKRVDALWDGFEIKTDQPVSAGGEGSAATPFALFLASLGTCTGYYVLTFCQKRGIPTAGIELTLTTVRDEESRMLSDVRIEISLPDDFPTRYFDACVHAASLCTVKKHLKDPPTITISATAPR